MNITIVCGARPNFIKVAPLIREINKEQQFSNLHTQLVYTGRKDDSTLESQLFNDLGIHEPDTYLGVDCENLNELTGRVMSKFEDYLQHTPTDAVIVVDDLASTMAVAIVTKKQGILLAHIAAGTRSFDITMPKEINRMVIDGLSDILFTAGISNNSIANREGAELNKVYMVGNILMDNLRYLKASGADNNDTLQKLQLEAKAYVVFTLNRKVLINEADNLNKIITTILQNNNHVPVIAPLRQKAKEAVIKVLENAGVENKADFHFIDPQDYTAFVTLTEHAKGIITDSGNVAEEATFNGVPCITLNGYTEHIETVKCGTNVLTGHDFDKLAAYTRDMCHDKWKEASLPDCWDGRTAERILHIMETTLTNNTKK